MAAVEGNHNDLCCILSDSAPACITIKYLTDFVCSHMFEKRYFVFVLACVHTIKLPKYDENYDFNDKPRISAQKIVRKEMCA